jgi:hypothetical protein
LLAALTQTVSATQTISRLVGTTKLSYDTSAHEAVHQYLSAMLSDPLTPPYNNFGEAVDIDNGAPLTISTPTQIGQHNLYMSTPTSNITCVCDSDGGSDFEESSDTYDPNNEQDMSDGGAVLTLTTSHAQELNNELDLLDADLMGTQNMAVLHNSTTSVHTNTLSSFSTYAGFPHLSIETQPGHGVDDYDMQEEPGHVAIEQLGIQAAEVAQQLQHLQDGQGHMGFQMDSEANTAFIDNSIVPFSF